MRKRASLLARINDPNDGVSWREFHDTYRRLIFGVARKASLSQVEAKDATQDTLITVARNIGEFRYEPQRCSFKTWLMMITRQRITWQLRKRQPIGGSQPAELAWPRAGCPRAGTTARRARPLSSACPIRRA